MTGGCREHRACQSARRFATRPSSPATILRGRSGSCVCVTSGRWVGVGPLLLPSIRDSQVGFAEKADMNGARVGICSLGNSMSAVPFIPTMSCTIYPGDDACVPEHGIERRSQAARAWGQECYPFDKPNRVVCAIRPSTPVGSRQSCNPACLMGCRLAGRPLRIFRCDREM
jgi:hypothetical protein